MKRILVLLTLLAGLGLASCDTSNAPSAPSSPGASKVIANDRKVDVFALFYNECCDEFIQVQGVGNFLLRENGVHFTVRNLTGTGSNGNSYTGHNASTQNTTWSTAEDGTVTEQGRMKVDMRNADGCSFKLSIHYRITVAPDGTLTEVFDNFEVECE